MITITQEQWDEAVVNYRGDVPKDYIRRTIWIDTNIKWIMWFTKWHAFWNETNFWQNIKEARIGGFTYEI